MKALGIAATGMLAQQTNVDVIANNIANANTTGFKSGRAAFQDLIYQTICRKRRIADLRPKAQRRPVGTECRPRACKRRRHGTPQHPRRVDPNRQPAWISRSRGSGFYCDRQPSLMGTQRLLLVHGNFQPELLKAQLVTLDGYDRRSRRSPCPDGTRELTKSTLKRVVVMAYFRE